MIALLFVCFFVVLVHGHRFIGGDGWNIVDYDEHYYYLSIQAKMAESLSVSNCSIDGAIGKHFYKYLPAKGEDSDLTVKIIPPSEKIFTEWRKLQMSLMESSNHHASARQFIKVTQGLCDTKQFKFYSEGHFRRSKGCFKMMKRDEKTGLMKKRINGYGATLHPDHSRCNHMAGVKACTTSVKKAHDYPIEIEDETPIANTAYPFLITAKNVVVAKSGMLAIPCGPFGLYSSCEATNWGLPSARGFLDDSVTCRKAMGMHINKQTSGGRADSIDDGGYGKESGEESDVECPHTVHDKIFVMSQYDDTQIGQFILESLPRLIYNLDFVYANPDMKIHFGFTKQKTVPAYVLPHNIFSWLGLSDRLINGTYFGKEIYMPREGGCQEPGYNMWELYNMRDVFLKKAEHEIGTGGRNNSRGWDYPAVPEKAEPVLGPMDYQPNDGDSDKPVVLLLKRSSSKFTQNQGDFKIRRWPPKLGGAGAVRDALAEEFPEHSIQIFSDSDYTLMMCHACAAQLFSRVDVVVGIHGAGLTNCIYMKPGGVVVEGIPHFDSRHAPVTGIFGRLSGMMGLNHYSYNIDEDFHPVKIAKDTRIFYDEVKEGQPRAMPVHLAHGD